MKNKIYRSVFMYAFMPTIIITIIDYLNIPSCLGIKVKNINYDVFCAVFNALIVIVLYIITFNLIDKRQMQKDDNAKATANILILSTYQKCLDILKIVDNQQLLEKYIIPKIDFNKMNSDNAVSINLQNNPFIEHTNILDLAEAGAISSKDLINYIKIIELYKSFIFMRITFFDIQGAKTPEQIDVCNKISQDKRSLETLLNTEIKELKNKLEEV